MNSAGANARGRRIAIALAVLFALVMVSMGAWAIVESHFVGTTRRSVQVTTDGVAAQWLGAMQASIGMSMLALAMPTRRAALWWPIGWVTLFGVCLVMAIRARTA